MALLYAIDYLIVLYGLSLYDREIDFDFTFLRVQVQGLLTGPRTFSSRSQLSMWLRLYYNNMEYFYHFISCVLATDCAAAV
jgi:hypothetical protein